MEDNLAEREIINRVANSGLITLDLEDYYPTGERVLFDLKPLLYQELMLREKNFRQSLKETDWIAYAGKHVAVTCTADAIVPTWAFMLVALQLEPHADMVVFGDLQALENRLFQEALSRIKAEDFRDAKVVVKGCSKYEVPVYAYMEIARRLRPVVASLMFGEACSTVPLYKRPKSV